MIEQKMGLFFILNISRKKDKFLPGNIVDGLLMKTLLTAC